MSFVPQLSILRTMDDPNEYDVHKDIPTPPEVEKLGKYILCCYFQNPEYLFGKADL